MTGALRQSASLILYLAIIFCQGASVMEAKSAQSYQPHLRWIEQDDGARGIFDGDVPVAAFSADDPAYSVVLSNVRLVPHAPTFIARLHISWHNRAVFKMALDEIEVDQSDPENLKVYFQMHDQGLRDGSAPEYGFWENTLRQETWLDVSYDDELRSYVFAIKSRLQVKEGRDSALAAKVRQPGLFPHGWEYANIWPANCNGIFPPRGSKRWQWCVYRAEDGHLYKIPHTHHLGQDKDNVRFAPDGILAYVADEEYNPVVELAGDTARFTKGCICFAAWDFHLNIPDMSLAFSPLRMPLEVSYRVYSLPYEQAVSLLEQAALTPALDIPEVKSPVYVRGGVNHFEPAEEYRKPGDAWFWQSRTEQALRNDPNCIWDLEEGCQTPGSLRIHRREAEGASVWYVTLKRNSQTHPLPEGKFRLRAMVKTEGVSGRACLGMGWYPRSGKNVTPGPFDHLDMHYSEPPLSGDNDWQELTLETANPHNAPAGRLYLILEGQGKCWFDEVEVTPLG